MKTAEQMVAMLDLCIGALTAKVSRPDVTSDARDVYCLEFAKDMRAWATEDEEQKGETNGN